MEINDTDNIVKEFLVESCENLDRLDRDLVLLEENPSDRETLSSIFRTIHTLKGSTSFLGYSKLEAVAHAGENLLSRLRRGELSLHPEITSALLTMVDALRQMLSSIERANQEGDADYSALIETLTRLHKSAPRPSHAPAAPAAATDQGSAPAIAERMDEVPVKQARPRPEDAGAAIAEPGNGDSRQAGESLLEQGLVQPRDIGEALAGQAEHGFANVLNGTIRVDVGLLDKLMNRMGELVLARNQILQFTATQKDAAFLSTSQRLNLITTELQEGVMKARMQPIGNIWSKFPRVVRDLALVCGKRVRIVMEGQETELDKTIIEAIKDPLTHLVRNAVDHGIEDSEARLASGKPCDGHLLLRAFHEGGQVNIEISDDGAGVDPDRVKQKALQHALITPEQAARMSDKEAGNLIFLPGFSTADKVTNVSGRGVGMDVVKTNVEKIGGTVELQSRPGRGTTVKMKIPLTLAIIPALIVTSSGDRYAIPQVSLLELVHLEGEQARKGIEMIHGAPVYRLRGNLLPLVYLSRELWGKDAGFGPASGAAENEDVNIVVLQADDRQFGLVVEGIHDTAEIVVKPLGKQLKGISSFAGATILGDGKVALILDVLGLAQCAHVVSEGRGRVLADGTTQSQERGEDRQTLLLFRSPDDGRMAIPLSLVARLEEFPRSAMEKAGHLDVVRYRGEIIPLIHVSTALPERRQQLRHSEGSASPGEGDKIQVVVHSDRGRSVGLVVDRILDIVEEPVAIQRPGRREGVLGSVVIRDRVIELLDVPGMIRKVDPGFFEPPAGRYPVRQADRACLEQPVSAQGGA